MESVCVRYVLMVVILIHFEKNYRVSGQGRMLEPPGRSTMWRVGYDTPINQNDNLLSCGGVKHRWENNNGKCGVCGNPWDAKIRDNEAGGKYSQGIITSVYTSGSFIEVTIDVANANDGYFEFRLCVNNNISKPITEDCLERNKLTLHKSNSTAYETVKSGLNIVKLKLPDGVVCDQCVLQLKYRSADHYGCDVNKLTGENICGFGHGNIQSEYYACADIAIYSDNKKYGYDIDKKAQQPVYQVFGVSGDVQIDSKNYYMKANRSKRFALYQGGSDYQQADSYSHGPNYEPMTTGYDVQYKTDIMSNLQDLRRQQAIWDWAISDQQIHPRSRARRRTHENTNLRRILIPHLNVRATTDRVFVDQHTGTVNQGGFRVGRGKMFPGAVPMVSNVRQIFGTAKGARFVKASPMLRQLETQVQKTFMYPTHINLGPQVVTQIEDRVLVSKQVHPTHGPKCQACPFDQCLDDKLDLDKIFPGLFENPLKFLDCLKYEKLFKLGKYNVVSEGLPDCSHPRFKRQTSGRPPFPIDDDDAGCCSTRPQVILPLTVESDNDTFTVVQLPDDRSQFLVQGICSRNRTGSCTSCTAEENFQWVLVYDGRVNTSPPVSFVPVKFPHYCRCYNPGRRIVTG